MFEQLWKTTRAMFSSDKCTGGDTGDTDGATVDVTVGDMSEVPKDNAIPAKKMDINIPADDTPTTPVTERNKNKDQTEYSNPAETAQDEG